MPKVVHDMVDAILRDNPDMDESKAWAIAYSKYKKDKGKTDADDPTASANSITDMEGSPIPMAKGKRKSVRMVDPTEQGMAVMKRRKDHTPADNPDEQSAEAEELLSGLQEKTIYRVFSGGREDFDSEKELTRKYKVSGRTNAPHHRQLRPELKDQPILRDLVGPMWGGKEGNDVIVRYEDAETNRIMSESQKRMRSFAGLADEPVPSIADSTGQQTGAYAPSGKEDWESGLNFNAETEEDDAGNIEIRSKGKRKGRKDAEHPGVPNKVDQIADALRRDDPNMSDERAHKIAWATYNKMGESIDGKDFGIGYKDDILAFFHRNPDPTDDEVHDFAQELGITPEELEREIYALFSDNIETGEGMTKKTIVGAPLDGRVTQNKKHIDYDLYSEKLVLGPMGHMVNDRLLSEATAQFKYNPKADINGTGLIEYLDNVSHSRLKSLYGEGVPFGETEKGYDFDYIFSGKVDGQNVVFTLYPRYGEWRIGGRSNVGVEDFKVWLDSKGIISYKSLKPSAFPAWSAEALRTSPRPVSKVHEAGFDLTDISAAKWKDLMFIIRGPLKPEKISGQLGWHWQGENVLVVTANDPISGVYHSGGREVEKDYAGYIGIEGDPAAVKKVVQFIKKNSSYKDFNSTSREFI